MMKKLLAASTVALMAASANAADSANMTGFYGALGLGYGVGNNHIGDAIDLSVDGVVGTLFLGYQKDFGRFVAGLELDGSLTSADGKVVGVKLKRKNAFGASAKLGTKLNGWLAYAKLGYRSAQYELETVAGNGKKRFNAFVPGLGMETMITPNIMFGGEWTYDLAGSKTVEGVKVQPRFSEFKLKVGYKF